jgi:hypothetical protein
MDEPVYSQAAIGYRSWALAPDGALRSTGLGAMRWRPGPNVAYCGAGGEHDAPHALCGCGLYARHDPPVGVEARAPWLAGAVAMRGRLLIHHDGIRAEEAVVIALAVPLDPHPIDLRRARMTAERYGVPLVGLDDLRFEAERYGAPVPLSDRPPPPEPDAAPRRLSGRVALGMRRLLTGQR